MWWVGAAIAAAGAVYANKSAQNEYLMKKAELDYRQAADRFMPKPKPVPASACGGCGSREILIHHGQRICPYCRGSRE